MPLGKSVRMSSQEGRNMMTQTGTYVTSAPNVFQAKLVSLFLQNLPLLLTA
jgi:hypothetical protein